MLGKLIKHEFRATARVMLPLFAALLVLSVLGNFSVRILETSAGALLNILAGLILFAFGVALIAVCVMAAVLMIKRFHNNLLSSEGYLTFALPASVHSLVWSKVLVSLAWFLATAVAVALAGLVIAFRAEPMTAFLAELREALKWLSEALSPGYLAIAAEVLILALLGGVMLCLFFYAALAVGHSFAKHKFLMSVVFFFVFQFAVQFFGTALITLLGTQLHIGLAGFLPLWHTAALTGIAAELLGCGAFYALTVRFLQKRLNLE